MADSMLIPAHTTTERPWRQAARGGTIEDRTFSKVTAMLPPRIAALVVSVPPSVRAEADAAIRAISALDSTHGQHLGALSAMLLRAESVASSKIERIEASLDDYARAVHGSKANESATSMVASTSALSSLVSSVGERGPILLDNILSAHRTLMADDRYEKDHAGQLRTMQNWIGGSDYSPRNALYVPPPYDTVAEYIADLLAYANRDDGGILEQAAIVHAQFESIHPFTDGNGRIGRALINTVFRRRGATRNLAIPLASAVVARRDDYFDALNYYRTGDAAPLTVAFARGAMIAATESMTSAQRLAKMPDQWRFNAQVSRAGSVQDQIIGILLNEPILSAEQVETRLGVSTATAYRGVSLLVQHGVLRPLTDRKRNQVWIAAELADELDDLGVRIAARARDEL